MEVQQRSQERTRLAADVARITDENASNEHRRHTSGAVFCRGRQQQLLLAKKKEQVSQSRQRRKNSSSMGAGLFCVFLALRRMDSEKRGLASRETGESYQVPMVDCL